VKVFFDAHVTVIWPSKKKNEMFTLVGGKGKDRMDPAWRAMGKGGGITKTPAESFFSQFRCPFRGLTEPVTQQLEMPLASKGKTSKFRDGQEANSPQGDKGEREKQLSFQATKKEEKKKGRNGDRTASPLSSGGKERDLCARQGGAGLCYLSGKQAFSRWRRKTESLPQKKQNPAHRKRKDQALKGGCAARAREK